MKPIILSAITLSTLLTSLPVSAACAFCENTKTQSPATVENVSEIKGVSLVRSGLNSGYYVVAPESGALRSLGFANVPYMDSDNVSRNGVGTDAIAFRFGADGRLEGLPVYVSQLTPDSSYTAKLRGLSPGRSTLPLVQELFGADKMRIEKQGAQTVVYLEVPVYNALTTGS